MSWQTTLAASTQDDEEYPVLTTDPFQANQSHSFSVRMNRARSEGSDLEFEIRIQAADDSEAARPAVLWRNARMQILPAPGEETYDKPLRELVTAETADQLQFGVGNNGVDVGPNDFISVGRKQLTIRVKEPSKMANMRFKVDAVIDVILGMIAWSVARLRMARELGKRSPQPGRRPLCCLIRKVRDWRNGNPAFSILLDLAQVSHREATPSDRDWIPAPFDNTYNKPERNYYHTAVKYHRDDRFLTEKILDRETAQQLDHAWTDLLTAFDYHDTIYRFILKKYELEGPGESITDVGGNWIESLSYPEREYAQILQDDFAYHRKQLDKAENRHLEEAIEFAGSAWRRPLTAKDRKRLEAFYHQLRDEKALDHEKAIRALLTRVLVAPRISIPYRKSIQESAADSLVRL